MKILGISGFEGAIPFKRARWPQLDEREYRISQGHDSAAALVVDGAVVAAVAEERINRGKHTGAFPRGAIACCLAEAGVTIDQIDELAHGFDYAPYKAIYALDPGSHDLYRDVYSRRRCSRWWPGISRTSPRSGSITSITISRMPQARTIRRDGTSVSSS